MRIAKAPVGLVFCLLALPIVFGLDVAAAAQTPSPTRSNRPPLVGTQWRLMSLSEGPFLHMAFRSYFTLKQAGCERANCERIGDGCNELRGTCESNGNSLRFQALNATGVFCLPSVPIKTPAATYQSDLFLKALHETYSFRIRGTALQLLDQKGANSSSIRAHNRK